MTKHKIMITVKKIEYYYRNWIVVLTDNIITFTCTLTLEGEGSKRLVREYYYQLILWMFHWKVNISV